MSSREQVEQVIRQAAEKWPSTFVARSKVREFSGGIISPGYLANLDSEGLGPKGAFKIGRQVAYPVTEFASWLIGRVGSA